MADGDFVLDTGQVVRAAVAKYNSSVVDRLYASFQDRMMSLTNSLEAHEPLEVPGALELSHGLRALAEIHPKPSALVALGCVIKGETYHFEVVCNVSAQAIQKVSEDLGLPVINGVLTCYNQEQALARAERKGAEFAEAAVYMAKKTGSLR